MTHTVQRAFFSFVRDDFTQRDGSAGRADRAGTSSRRGRLEMASLRIFGVAASNRHRRSSTAVGSIVGAGIAMVTGLTVCGGGAIFAQDKHARRASNGIVFSEFIGYADWQAIGVNRDGDLIEVTRANSVMISAFRAGVSGNGRPFPDGSKAVKIHWKANSGGETPHRASVPEALHDVDLVVKDSKRFAETGGWGHAHFSYDAASDRFAPEASVDHVLAGEAAGRLQLFS